MAAAIRVLYVDDEPSLLDIGKVFLERAGNFDVTTAISAPEAIRLLEQQRFDAIISDYQMPEMDGIQFLVEVRNRFGQIPFILFTGRGREQVVIQAINSGADFYLQKGGDPKAQFAELSHKIMQATSRKKAEVALVESEERLRTMIEQSPLSIQMLSPDGRTVQVNGAFEKLWGITLADLKDYNMLKDEQLISLGIMHYIKKGFSGEACKIPPVQYNTHESVGVGEKRWVLSHIYPVRDPAGTIHNIVVVHQDITERKQAEEVLFKINQKLNVLSQLTRKDLTNQIFVLNSYLELTKNQLIGQDRIIETLQKGVQEVRLIQETIEFTKDFQDMGAKPPKWQNIKMTMLLGISHISIGNIRHSIETENLEIFADPLLEKVCQRLFENSVKHGDHISRIRVWYTTTPDGATIFFEDDGIGISAEQKEQIFLRSEGTRVSMRSLIFAREILDITGITIRETGEPGKGARFEMTVPKGAWRMTGKNDDHQIIQGSQ